MRTTSSRIGVRLALAGLSAAPLAAQSVHVVDDDGGPGVDFTELQTAIDAAAENDILLVRAGSYAGPFAFPCFGCVSVTGKSLSLVADGPGPVNIATLRIEDLGPDQSVLLRGFEFSVNNFLFVEDVQGTVWIEDVFLPGFFDQGSLFATLDVEDARAVHLNRSEVRGGAPHPLAGFGAGAPIQAAFSGLYVYDSVVQAGNVGSGADGADGIRMFSGLLHVAGSTITATSAAADACGEGGSAIVLAGDGSEGSTLDNVLTAGGAPACGTPGQEVLAAPGTHLALVGPARSFEVNSPVRVGELVTLELDGEPGDLVILDFSAGMDSFYDPFFKGVYQLAVPPVLSLVLGPLPASGELDLSFTFASFGPGFQGVNLFAQADFFSLPAQLTMGGGSALTVLNENL